MSKIILCGASSADKASLAGDWCSQHRDYARVREAGADMMEQDALSAGEANPGPTGVRHMELTFQEQNRRESELGDRPFIAEAGPDSFVRAYLSSEEGAVEAAESRGVSECFARYRQSLVVLVCPVEDITDRGEERTDRDKFIDALRHVLHEFRIPHMSLDGNGTSRLKALENAVGGKIPITQPLDEFLDHLCLSFFLATSKTVRSFPSLPVPGKEARVRTFEISGTEVALSNPEMDNSETNRMVDRYGEEEFVLIKFIGLPPDCVKQTLKQGVEVNGDAYQFLGCSSEGIKKNKSYMMRGSAEYVENVLSDCGDFSGIKMVSKRLKRISQLFSVGKDSGVAVSEENFEVIEDITSKDGKYNFTDGCGFVGVGLAERITKGAYINVESPEDNIPSVFQIRLQGCKGVVSKEPEIEANRIQVRKSMHKFLPGKIPFPNVWVCGYSRPYAYGNLNKQIIVLLSGLEIKDEVFLSKQEEFFIGLESMLVNSELAIVMLNWKNRTDIARRIASCTTADQLKQDNVVKPLHHVRHVLIEKLEKLQIPILDSRTLFGICDPRGLLEYGECFIRITDNGVPRTLPPGTRVIVVKNPCYLLGDVRVLTTMDRPQLNHLVDCIVFPVRGQRPHPDEIAGSDLDGDQYFVCWDVDLIPVKPDDPYEFPSGDMPPCSGEISREMSIDFLVDYRNNMGKISTYFQYWADLQGPNCTKCQRLGALFSRSVDASKTGEKIRIARDLRPPENDPDVTAPDRPKRVWERMLELALARQKILKARDSLRSGQTPVSEDFILRLLGGKELGISEFKLFQLVSRWCQAQEIAESAKLEKLRELSDHINFGLFTLAQKEEAIKVGVPDEIVMNALNKSRLMKLDLLRSFSLTLPVCGWKFYFRTPGCDLDWQHLIRALTEFPETMLILELDLDVRVAIHFLATLQQGQSTLPPRSLVAYFDSPHMALQLRHISNTEYTVDLLDGIIQAFRGNKRGQSFLWFAGRKGEQNPRISVDLTRFRRAILRVDKHPLIKKQAVLSAEVFVKSKLGTDLAYFDILDTDQSGDLFTADSVSSENLEELPSDEEDMEEVFPDMNPIGNLDPNEAVRKMKRFAQDGKYLRFARIVASLNDEMMTTITHSELSAELLSLLDALVVKYSHKNPSEDLTECIENLLKSPHVIFQTPQDLLLLYSSLNKLHLDRLTREHLKTLDNPPFKLESVAQYIDCITHFEWWCFLPAYVSRSLLNDLYRINSALLAVKTSSSDAISCSIPYSIQDVASMAGVPLPSIDEAQLELYKCYFGFLMLKHLLADCPQPDEFRKLSDTENSVCMMRATDPRTSTRTHADTADIKTEEKSEDELNPSGDAVVKKKKSNKPQTYKICFYRLHRFASNKFTDGSFVKIRHLTNAPSKYSQKPIALGRITRVVRNPGFNEIAVDIFEPVPNCIKRSAQLEAGYWSLTLLGNVTSFQRACKALQRLDSSPDITPILISPEAFPAKGDRETQVDNLDPHEINEPIAISECIIYRDGCKACEFRQKFNPSQESAICAALNQRLTLIHGPPGTGKTCVASEIVHRMCHLNERNGVDADEKTKILVAAETNNAVDNLTRKLVNMGMRVVRVGSQVSPDISKHTLDKLVRARKEELGEEARGEHLSPRLKKELLQSVDVIATTCSGAGDTDLKGIRFSFILIDEATQAVEPVSLIGIAKSCQKLVLIGDPKQLAPTVTDREQEECRGIPALKDLQETLFHRLHSKVKSLFLEEQYRMHPYIAQFPSKQFYGGKLKSGVAEHERIPPNLKFMDNRPVVFINVTESEERPTYGSHRNEREAEVVVDVIKELRAAVSAEFLADVAILTPYVGQVRCIREKLENESLKVDVCTIDGFQGKEKEVIVFSTVRNSEQGQLGFTVSEHRINVLLTRAKSALIGVGSAETMANSKVWYDWLDENLVITEDQFYGGVVMERTDGDSSRPRAGRDRNQLPRAVTTRDNYNRSGYARIRSANLIDYYKPRQRNPPHSRVHNSPKRRTSDAEDEDRDGAVRYGKRGRIDAQDKNN